MNQTNKKNVDPKKKHNFRVIKCHTKHNHPISQVFATFAMNRI